MHELPQTLFDIYALAVGDDADQVAEFGVVVQEVRRHPAP